MTPALPSVIQTAYATGWIVAAPIGPVNLEIIRRSLRDRLLTGFCVGLGAVTIDVTYLTIFSMGLGAFLKVPAIATALHLVGGGFLAFLGIMALMEGRGFLARGEEPAIEEHAGARRFLGQGPGASYLVGLFLTGTNPMTIAFWSALSLQFAGLPLGSRLAASLSLFAGCFSWVLTLMVILKFARSWVGPRLFGFVTVGGGLCLLYFGLLFLVRGVALEHWLEGLL